MSNIVNINNRDYEISDSLLDTSVLHYLREVLCLTGTKNGCEKGLCGTCTILIDNKATKSCRTKLKNVIGKNIITIEGITLKDSSLHPIQQAFLDCGAVQCGFCTPGMILSSYSLLIKNSNPTREEVAKQLKPNLCRCTGYQQIIDAVIKAGEIAKENNISLLAGCLQ